MNINEIYLVIVKADIHNSYDGLDDITAKAFTNVNVARDYLKKEYEETQKKFIDSDGEYYTECDEFEDDYFIINDGLDYYSAEIRKLTLNEVIVYECKGNGDK